MKIREITSPQNVIIYRGGTHFALIAQKLGYLVRVGSWLEPAEARVPEIDAESFEALLAEEGAPFARVT
jgi:hypothetical protein